MASVVLLVTTQWHIFFMFHQYIITVLRKDCSEMLGDLRQMCKQFIQQQQFIPLSLSHICLCVNCIMKYILTNISHPDPVASLRGQCACLPHLPLVCGSGGICVYASSFCSVYSFSSSCPKTVSRTREVFPTGSTTLLRLQLSRTRDCAHRSRHVGL